MKREYIAELIGTFALVFCGTGAIVINDITNGTITHPGIAITFGLIVTAMIYTLGGISGAHMNPAVTIAFSLTNLFDRKNLIGYIIAQLVGAFLASFALKVLFVEHQGYLGATLPSGTWHQSFILEIILTYFLMLTILFVSQDEKNNQLTGIIVGMVVWLEALFAGPITGASMNPTRSISPAVVSGHLDHLWIYILAPIIGAILATYSWNLLKEEDKL